MPTFNNWTIISMPTSPASPATVDFKLQNTVALSVSPFTGQQQVQNWQTSWIEASISLPTLTHAQAQEWIAFMMALEGMANVFQFGDPLAATPRGSGAGTPLVNGSGQTGRTLSTKGWTPSAAGVLLAGDWLQIGYRLYRNLTTANADGSGHAALSIAPQIRESPTDGDTIILTHTKGLFRLSSNASEWSELESRYYGMQFKIREAL